MPHSRILLLFTKPARPGRVKTRLVADGTEEPTAAGGLNARRAAELHWALLQDQVARLTGGAFTLQVAWALEAGEAVPDLGVPGVRQEGEDLGERLYRALAAAGREAPRVAAVGSDHPDLDRERVEEAFRRLEAGADLVLGPAADGGYYLVALRADRVDRALFQGIDWSTPRVLDQTRERAGRQGLAVELLEVGHDVDTPADLARLARSLAAGDGSSPRTRELLSSWGFLA